MIEAAFNDIYLEFIAMSEIILTFFWRVLLIFKLRDNLFDKDFIKLIKLQQNFCDSIYESD